MKFRYKLTLLFSILFLIFVVVANAYKPPTHLQIVEETLAENCSAVSLPEVSEPVWGTDNGWFAKAFQPDSDPKVYLDFSDGIGVIDSSATYYYCTAVAVIDVVTTLSAKNIPTNYWAVYDNQNVIPIDCPVADYGEPVFGDEVFDMHFKSSVEFECP